MSSITSQSSRDSIRSILPYQSSDGGRKEINPQEVLESLNLPEIFANIQAYATRQITRRLQGLPVEPIGCLADDENSGLDSTCDDPQDSRRVLIGGRSLYLGNGETGIRRLFNALCPLGTVKTIGELVNELIDHDYTSVGLDRAEQRIRKIVSKLRSEFKRSGVAVSYRINTDRTDGMPAYSIQRRIYAAGKLAG